MLPPPPRRHNACKTSIPRAPPRSPPLHTSSPAQGSSHVQTQHAPLKRQDSATFVTGAKLSVGVESREIISGPGTRNTDLVPKPGKTSLATISEISPNVLRWPTSDCFKHRTACD